MPVITRPFGKLGANAHIVYDEKTKDALLFDPPAPFAYAAKVVQELGLTLRGLFLTHLHFDHALGAATAIESTNLPIFVGEDDWTMRDVLLGRAMQFGIDQVPPFEAEVLAEGEHTFGSLRVQALHVPGHSKGSLCYYFPDMGILIAGDVLFAGAIGRSDLPGGDTATLLSAIKAKLLCLPDDTLVYCGHGEETTIGTEKKYNPYLRNM